MFHTKVVDKIKTRILCSIIFFSWRSCRSWDNVVNTAQPDMPQMTLWGKRIACWIPKAPHTHTQSHSEYVNTAFPLWTMVATTRLNICLFVHCLSCYYLQSPDLDYVKRIRYNLKDSHHRRICSSWHADFIKTTKCVSMVYFVIRLLIGAPMAH